jgi:putative Mg2+ transporter-C (MgtC) family protein
LLISFVVGSAIGFEREYRSKAAGLRTMLMICLGSTIFTEMSLSIDSDSKDRIASNIVTGVGFLGAGVIFKDGLTVTGLTTASTIWISAALGTAIGMGEYFVAFVGSGIVLIVLSLLEKFQTVIEHMHQVRSYKISFKMETPFAQDFETELKRQKIEFRKKRDLKEDNFFLVIYDISGREKKLNELNLLLKKDDRVLSYEY